VPSGTIWDVVKAIGPLAAGQSVTCRCLPLHRPAANSCNIGGFASHDVFACLPSRGRACLGGLAVLGLLLPGCTPAHRQASWALYPLPRSHPHDGLAVVSQPDGYGLHIWIDADLREKGICQPRWRPDAARLFNGNGSAPFSSGLATREEFFQAVARRDVRRALRQQSEALCREREPQRSFRWQEPPRDASQVKEELLPLLEEHDLLSDPEAIEQQENQLLNPGQPDQTNGSADRQ
jgi:hypothetical protein